MENIARNIKVWLLILAMLVVSFFALSTTSIVVSDADAQASRSAVRYAAWLSECYYGGYSWYDYYYNGYYYWGWC